MSDQTIKVLVIVALMIHGLGHGGAIGALVAQGRVQNTGGWLPARSWLLPSVAPSTAATAATVFWLLSMLGFVAAALSFWGVLVPGDQWRTLAVLTAFVSLSGVVLFIGTWPAFNTIAALAMNVAVFVTQFWLRWPPLEMFGK